MNYVMSNNQMKTPPPPSAVVTAPPGYLRPASGTGGCDETDAWEEESLAKSPITPVSSTSEFPIPGNVVHMCVCVHFYLYLMHHIEH